MSPKQNQRRLLQLFKAQEASDGFEIGLEVEVSLSVDNHSDEHKWFPATIVGRSLSGWVLLDSVDWLQQERGERSSRMIRVIKDTSILRIPEVKDAPE